jgi:hypothetical protein
LARANSALLAITAAPPAIAVAANALPVSQQHCELQRCRSRSNVASCNALSASPRHCVPAPSPAIAELCSFDFCRTSVGLSSDVRQTFVGLSSNVCPTSVGLSSDFHRTFVEHSFVLRPAYVIADVIVLRPAGVIHLPSCALLSCRLDVLHPRPAAFTSYVISYWSPAFYTLWSCILWSCVL